MTVENDEEAALHTYLLGGLPLAEQMNIEERLLIDGDYVELLSVVEEELIDSYLRGTLSEGERVQFENHFLITPARRRKLRMAKALRRYVNNAHPAAALDPERKKRTGAFWWQSLFTPAWQAAFAALLVLALGLGIWRVFLHQSLADKGRAALQAALRESPVESRIAGFNWPPQRVTLGEGPGNLADNTALESAERYLLDAVNAQPGPDSYYALGQFYLAKGERDKAIEQFERALAGDPNNAKMHSDLGAALLERAKSSAEKGPGADVQDFNQSLEHLNRALALNDSLLEAMFNRALCHQYMQVLSQAEAEWQEYLKRDSNSRWADEARRHLKEVEENKQKTSHTDAELLDGFLDAYRAGDDEAAWKLLSATREIGTGRLIWWQLAGDFLNSTTVGKQNEMSEVLRALRYAGELELHPRGEAGKARGDPYVSELEGFYRASPSERRAALAQAHNHFNEGNRLYGAAQRKEAFSRYNSAREIFKRAGDEWETLLTDYLIGHCHIELGETEQGLSLFSRVVKECRGKGYLWLLGQGLVGMGMAQDRLAHHSEALENTKEALEISEGINDVYNIQRSLAQIADQYKKLADYESATTYLNLCLKQISAWWPGARQMWRNYDQLTQVLVARRFYAAAGDYADEALRLALEMQNGWATYVSYLHLAIIRWRQQDYAEALKLAQSGLEAAPDSGDPRAYACLQLGHLHRQAGDLQQALYDYDQSIKYIDRVESDAGSDADSQAARAKTYRLPALRYDAHKGRLFCLLAQGSDAEAEEELKTTLELLENHRESIRDEQNRNTFFNVEQSVYDAAINYQFSRRKDLQAVFDYSERSRARSLLSLMNTGGQADAEGRQQGGSQPLSLPEVQRRLPDKTQLIEYAALDNKLLICLVSKSEFLVKESAIGLSDLTDKVLKYRQSILRQESDTRAQAQELYSLLIDPVKLSPQNGTQVCFVPDKVLYSLPFHTLVSPASGNYLVEDYQPMMSASAAVYLACSERKDHTAVREQERLLAVGDVSFDRAAFPMLPRLPSTRAQVESIGNLYSAGSPVVLTGDGAKKDRVKREMEKADVIQVASHYVVYEGSPADSRLLLAQEAGGRQEVDGSAGSLRAGEVLGLKLRAHAPLVVLSACQSGVEHYYNGEGMIGMSRAFIAAGSPLVVATLWEVEAHATDELITSFHRHRKREGLSSAEALIQAQRDMLKGRLGRQYQHPYCWAGFTAIGGHTDF